ncbi:MAG: hypothetical protein ACLFU1_03770 [Alphaproteobacteria bacterium]
MTDEKPRMRPSEPTSPAKNPSGHSQPVYQKSENKDLSADEYYDLLNDKIRALYPEGISDERCHAATRNFIGFGKLLLEMKRQKGLSNKNDE